jgi:hypothetical protein
VGTLALALATTLMAVASAGAATITNGSFDDGLAGWHAQTSIFGIWEPQTDCNGTGACYMSNTSEGDSFGLIEQSVTLEPNHTDQLTLSLNATGGGWRIPSSIAEDLNVVGQEARVDVMSFNSDPWSITDAGVLATVFKSLTLSTHRFESMPKGSKLFAARSHGAKLNFDLTEDASIAVSLKKYSVAKDSWSPVPGSATLVGKAGPNSTKFTAKLNRRKPLAPGEYMLVFRPEGSAGNVGVQSVRVIRVLRPR